MNRPFLEQMENCTEPVMVVRVEEVEMDEMWSFVRSKKQQRWLWSAIDHRTGKMLAYVLAPYEDTALIKLKVLLHPFGLTHFYTDAWLGGLICDCSTSNITVLEKLTPRRLSASI